MKKIISLVCVVAMLFAFAVTANAATTGSMAFEADAEVTVGDEFLVTIKYIPGADSCFKGGTIKLEWNYADGVASIMEEVDGIDAFTSNTINFKPATNIYTIKHAATADDAWQELTTEGVYSVVKFKAEKVGTFTLSAGSAAVTFADEGNTDRLSYKGTSMAPITITVKDNAPVVPPFTPETIKADAAIAATADVITLPKSEGSLNTNDYTQVAVFTGSFEAATNYSKAGLIWVKDGVESTNTFDVADGNAVSGAGSFEYNVAMYAIPTGVTITAIPYYVTAQ